MTNLVAKLRARAAWPGAIEVEAADEIERLHTALDKAQLYLSGEYYAEALGILCDALEQQPDEPSGKP